MAGPATSVLTVAYPPFQGVTCNQRMTMQVLCVLWFLVFVFYLLKTFPGLWEDHLEPAAAGLGGRQSHDEEADGAPQVWVPARLVLRFLFAWGGGRRGATFPLPGTPFPPFFTWRTPTRPSRPSSSGISSRKPSLTSRAFASVLPPLCACLSLSVSQQPPCSLLLSLCEPVAPSRL